MFFRLQMLDTELLSTLNSWLKLERNQQVTSQSLMRLRRFMFSRLQMLDIELLSMLKLIQRVSSHRLVQLLPDQRKFPCSILQSLRPTLLSTTSKVYNRKEMLHLRQLQRRRRLIQLAQKAWTHGYTKNPRKIPEFSQILTVLNYTLHMVFWLSLLKKLPKWNQSIISSDVLN